MYYDYKSEVKSDIIAYLKENNYTPSTAREADEAGDLYDDLFLSDSVTGNASGSYYCNAYKAAEAIAHNWDILREALQEFGGLESFPDSEEAADVTIRCYIVGQVLQEAIDEFCAEWEEENETENE